VHPGTDKITTVAAATLSTLILMVRENKVTTTAMDIDVIPEMLMDHC
jgi:hypothetical protein